MKMYYKRCQNNYTETQPCFDFHPPIPYPPRPKGEFCIDERDFIVFLVGMCLASKCK